MTKKFWFSVLGLVAIVAIALFLIASQRTITISTPQPLNQKGSGSLININSQNLNLTEALAEQIAEKIVEQNPQGPSVEGENEVINVDDPDELILNTLENQLADFEPGTIRPEISIDDFKIIETSVKEDLENYFNSFLTILSEHLSGVAIDESIPENTDFEQIIQAYDNAAEDLYILPVPSDLIYVHRQAIYIVSAQEIIFSLIKNYQEDPLKALFAAQIQEEIAEDAELLQENITEYIKNNNLSI